MAGSFVTALVAMSVVGGVVCLGLALVAWRHRSVPAALPFGGLMLAVGGWVFADAAFLLTTTTEGAYIADSVIRAASAQVPPLWIIFILAFAGYEQWVSWRTIAALWVIPSVFVVLTVTAPVTGLASTPQDVIFLTSNGIRAPSVSTGLVYDLHLLYSYLLMTVGYTILFSFLLRSRAMYRRQTAVIVLASLAPVVVNTALNLGLTPHPGIDMTPVAFVAAGVVFGWALVRYEFLTVTPMAGDVLIDELPDPVFVLDENDSIIDLNPAAESTFGLSAPHGESISVIDESVPAALADGGQLRLPAENRNGDGGPAHFECSVTHLEDQYGTERTTLVVLRDVTGQQRRQYQLEALQEATRKFLTASTDEAIAEISVEYADEVLGAHGTAVFLTDGAPEQLMPVAMTATVDDVFERGATPDQPIQGMLVRAYEDEDLTTQELPGEVGGSPERALAVPLGDHGVLWIGTCSADVFAPDDEGFATILARTTQVALTRVKRESDLRQSRSSVERRSEQIAFFNGVLRHRLRNALLVIQGRADHLRTAVTTDAERHLDVVVNWCDDLAELSEEIRAVNDTVTATESARLDTVDLSHVLHTSLQKHEAANVDVTFETDIDEDLAVQANELAMRVVDSVVENAIIHNDREDPHIEIWTVRAADRIQVHVADDGPGMDDDMKSTVFERDLSTSQTASGFGLYFVSVLMNLYGGTVWFEDNHPRGTIAVLEFQVATEGGADATSGTEDLSADGGTD